MTSTRACCSVRPIRLCCRFQQQRMWMVTTIRCFSVNMAGISMRLMALNSATDDAPGHVGSCCAGHYEEKPISEKRNISVKNLFSEYGIPLKSVKKQLDIGRLSFGKTKERIEFLQEIGLNQNEVSKVLTKRPTVLVTKIEILQSRVGALRKVGIEPSGLVHAVKNSPGILTTRTEESLPLKVQYFSTLKVKPKLQKEELLHMLTKCPDIIGSCSLETIQAKVNFFETDLKFNKQQLRNLLLKQPSVLTFSTESMQLKYAYCYDSLNAHRSSIARCPRIFQCSLQRMKERHKFLVKVGRLKEGMILDDYGLGVITTNSDKYFAEKVALSTLDEFVTFKQILNDGNSKG